MQYMIFIGQNLREKIDILLLADVSEGTSSGKKPRRLNFFMVDCIRDLAAAST